MPASLRELRRKIKGIQHIHQITRAMKMVATAKLKRVQQTVQAGRVYEEHLRRVLAHVAAAAGDVDHPYLQPREVKSVGVLLVAGDRGLCGAFNRNIFELATDFIAEQHAPVQVITVGDRIQRMAQRRRLNVAYSFSAVADPGDSQAIQQIAALVRSWYERGEVDLVQAVYAEFISVVRHPAVSRQLLPVEAVALGVAEAEAQEVEYIFEPPAPELLAEVLPRALDAEIVQILLGTQAAAQAARMLAMTAATDNAKEMIGNLTRLLNRARQEEITAELLDVVSGAKALQTR